LAVAANCCVDPAENVAVPGETEMVVRAFTLKVAVPLMPPKEAVTAVEPDATAVARPAALMVATAGLAADHCAVAVTLCVEPSL
jgi:hypothetical protein